MSKVKWREFATLDISTESLIEGCNCSKHNYDLIDEIDALGLDRSKALSVGVSGELYKVSNFMDFKLTPEEIESEKRSWEILLNKN